jgi:glycosyltransferase involved in cell wall biosynthesis
MFNTFPEIELAKKLYQIPEGKITLVSLGFKTGRSYEPEHFRKKYALSSPFVIFAGRREGGKNIPLLIEYFRTYKQYNKNDLKLVLMGTGEIQVPPESKKDILDFGYMKEKDKLDGFSAALFFCQPSINESLSIVIMESWLSGRPVLVHGDCAVTRDHCLRSKGGLFFQNYFEFEECLNFFLKEKELSTLMGKNGKTYVEKNFSWEAVLDRFEEALDKFGV